MCELKEKYIKFRQFSHKQYKEKKVEKYIKKVLTNKEGDAIIITTKRESNLLNIKGRRLTPMDTVKETIVQYVSGAAEGSSQRISLKSGILR